jgi:hypothetical protein
MSTILYDYSDRSKMSDVSPFETIAYPDGGFDNFLFADHTQARRWSLVPWRVPASTTVLMRQIVLPQKIFSIIIPVGRPHHAVNVLLCRFLGVVRKLPQAVRPLMVEFNQDHPVGRVS